jgi:hypothetical protein
MILLKERILRNLRNIPGWNTTRKIVVFESDDWGSIRMPSKDAYKKLEKSGLRFNRNGSGTFNCNDSLATSEDLAQLFEVLASIKDINGNHPVFTVMSIVANPDFKQIRDSLFSTYTYEPFVDTLKKYPGCEKSFELWVEGMFHKLFIPQMHGREHLNVRSWITALQRGDNDTHLAFNEGLWSFAPGKNNTYYQQAFSIENFRELESQKQILKTGLDLFEELFGYRARYFVPPNGVINNALNDTLVENGIHLRSTTKVQKEPVGGESVKRRLHYLGQKDRSGITYILRNCTFEPGQPNTDWVNNCLKEISVSFKWNKPAIIGTHRVNYIGAINKSNRNNGLEKLQILLKSILKYWPDVEFLTTVQLGELITQKQFN